MDDKTDDLAHDPEDWKQRVRDVVAWAKPDKALWAERGKHDDLDAPAARVRDVLGHVRFGPRDSGPEDHNVRWLWEAMRARRIFRPQSEETEFHFPADPVAGHAWLDKIENAALAPDPLSRDDVE